MFPVQRDGGNNQSRSQRRSRSLDAATRRTHADHPLNSTETLFPGKFTLNRQIPQLDPLPERVNQIFNDCPERNLAKETLGLQERIVPDS